MASRKEYEMLFQLNAQMGSSYNSTFSSAQQQIVSLQNEINALSSLQSDISAYEKQQQAVENTKAKLETLQQQYQNIETEIQNTEGFSSSLENQLLSKQQQIDKTSASLEKQTEKLDEMGKALEDAGVDTSNLTGESERLEKEMGDVKEAQEDVAESAKDMGDAGTNAISDIEQILSTAGIAAALKEICEAFMDCINVAASFESTMSTVEAISGATSEEMEQLTACAKELGSTTAFTAQQSAEAMTYMAMAGWETEDMLSGMQGVMDLAAASGEDLAQVADIVTDAMTAFGMEASESAHFADVLAATATNSNTSVSQMGETFKNVAPLAGTLGYSIEDVSVLMGLMADNGIKASTAGTALKNTLNGLVSGATLSCDALGDYEVSVVNSDGTTKDLSDTIDELRWAFDQMTEQEKISNAQTIAGTRSYTGLLAILNSTDEQYEELTESINTCSGAANEMAEIKLDNMTGSLTLMQSAWEGLRITIGEQFTPALSKLYDMLANVMQWIDQFIQNNPIIVKLIAAVVAGVTAFAVALGVYTAATKIAEAATKALGKAMDSIPFVIAATAIVSLVSAVVLFATTARDDGLPALEDLTEAAQNLSDTMDTVSQTYNDSVADAEAAATAAGDYVDRLFDLQDAGLDTTESQDEFNAICATLLEIMPELADLIDVTTDSYGNLSYVLNGTKQDFYDLIDAQKEQAIAEAYNDAMADSYSAYADATVELTKNQQLLEGATRDLKEAETSRTNAINEISDALVESCGYTYDELEGMGLLEGQIGNLDQKYIDMYNSIDEYNDAIYEGRGLVEQYQAAVDIGTEKLADAEEQIDTTKEAYDAYKDSIDAATAAEEEAAAQQEALNAQVDDFSV
ncbi:MAG: phage tail tape measure protein, partial [Coriobacteriaceae bacterium]|nr:phage tail tape measure protein [Coriobacteriaceae bacterium]